MLFRSLSARLLVLTIFFVMVSEVLIFVPSVARFRMTYFDNHLAAGHLATLALAASPNGRIDQALTDRLLADVGAHAVILHRPNGMVFMLDSPVAPKAEITFDLRRGNIPIWIERSLETLARSDNRVMRVLGPAPNEPGATVEELLDEAPLRHEMWAFGKRIVELSILHFADDGGARLPQPAMAAGPPDAPHHREHDPVPRGSGGRLAPHYPEPSAR